MSAIWSAALLTKKRMIDVDRHTEKGGVRSEKKEKAVSPSEMKNPPVMNSAKRLPAGLRLK